MKERQVGSNSPCLLACLPALRRDRHGKREFFFASSKKSGGGNFVAHDMAAASVETCDRTLLYVLYAVWLSHNHFIGSNAEPPAGEIVIREQRGEEEEEGRITTFIKEACKGSQPRQQGGGGLNYSPAYCKKGEAKEVRRRLPPLSFSSLLPPSLVLQCNVGAQMVVVLFISRGSSSR